MAIAAGAAIIVNHCVTDPSASVYTCEFCRSTYSHPGNFKQHLGKHERETGCVSAAYNAGYLGPSSDVDTDIIHSQNGAPRTTPKLPSAPCPPPPPTVSYTLGAAATATSSAANSHLNNALRSAIADKVCSGDASAGPMYHCDICGRDFKHPGNYKQHMSSHMRTVSSVHPSPAIAATASIAVVANPLLVRSKPQPSAAATSSASSTLAKGKSGGSLKCEICDQVSELYQITIK